MLTHWKRPWCWEGLGAGGKGDDRGWDGWMASPTRWTWVWVNSGSWWWTRRPSMLQFMGSQRVGHNWATELIDWLRVGKNLKNWWYQMLKVKVTQSFLTVTPWTVRGIVQARILEWVAYPFSMGSSQPGIELGFPTLQADSLPTELSGKPKCWRGCVLIHRDPKLNIS